jgi:hypothetical protein
MSGLGYPIYVAPSIPPADRHRTSLMRWSWAAVRPEVWTGRARRSSSVTSDGSTVFKCRLARVRAAGGNPV